MIRYEKNFPDQIVGFDFDLLEQEPNSVYALSAELSLVYFNPAWIAFADANGGSPDILRRFGLGTPIASVLDQALQDFYLYAYQRTLETGEVWHHNYECSSPDWFRLFHQIVYPFHNRQGLIVINSLRREHPHHPEERSLVPPDETQYRMETGLIVQCCNCRRFQHNQHLKRWDWVPAWVTHMPSRTTGGLCLVCREYYWK